MQVKNLLIILFFIGVSSVVSLHQQHCPGRLVILDPSGDAHRTGRKIGDNFERGLTLQCAEKIKEYIEQHAYSIKVVITRAPGDSVYDLQNASLSNRLHADLFVNLNFYHSQETKPTLFLYQFSYGNDFACCNQELMFRNYDEAYKINKQVTDELVKKIKQSLSQTKHQGLFNCAGSYHIPAKPLIGVVSPGLMIEAGLKNKELWVNYIEPLAQAIIEALR